jgi:acetyl esterase/lipase
MMLALCSLVLPAVVAVAAPSAWAWTQDPECANVQPAPTVANVVYSSPSGSDPLTLDVYETGGPAGSPALVVVHGGSWKTGCKGATAPIAARFRDAGFTVFNVAYRSDCIATKPPPILDDPTYCVGKKGAAPSAMVGDIQAAVSWVRQNGAGYGADPTRVALFGDSSGGHISYTAAATGSPHGSAPDVVTAWSGNTEMRVFPDGTDVCTGQGQSCVTVHANFFGCLPTACPALYDAYSPYSIETSAGPPAFIANGSTSDGVPYRELGDYASKLGSLGIPFGTCSVPSNKGDHGLQLADKLCTETGQTTFDSTVAFLLGHV